MTVSLFDKTNMYSHCYGDINLPVYLLVKWFGSAIKLHTNVDVPI